MAEWSHSHGGMDWAPSGWALRRCILEFKPSWNFESPYVNNWAVELVKKICRAAGRAMNWSTFVGDSNFYGMEIPFRFFMYKIFCLALSVFLNLNVIHFAHGTSPDKPARSFSATEFFEVIHPSIKRRPNLPGKVSYSPVHATRAEFAELLLGHWRLQPSCSGRPVFWESLADLRVPDGVTKPWSQLTFLKDNDFEHRYKSGALQIVEVPYQDLVRSGRYRVVETDDADVYSIQFFNVPLPPINLRAVTINETGEAILINESKVQAHSKICLENEKLEILYTQIPIF